MNAVWKACAFCETMLMFCRWERMGVAGSPAVAADLPGDSEFGENDAKIWARELIRLELSLQEVKREPGELLICALHFPPASALRTENELTALLQRYAVDICIYGHLHGKAGVDRAPSGFQTGSVTSMWRLTRSTFALST